MQVFPLSPEGGVRSLKTALVSLSEYALKSTFPIGTVVDLTLVRKFADVLFIAVGPWLHDHIHRHNTTPLIFLSYLFFKSYLILSDLILSYLIWFDLILSYLIVVFKLICFFFKTKLFFPSKQSICLYECNVSQFELRLFFLTDHDPDSHPDPDPDPNLTLTLTIMPILTLIFTQTLSIILILTQTLTITQILTLNPNLNPDPNPNPNSYFGITSR